MTGRHNRDLAEHLEHRPEWVIAAPPPTALGSRLGLQHAEFPTRGGGLGAGLLDLGEYGCEQFSGGCGSFISLSTDLLQLDGQCLTHQHDLESRDFGRRIRFGA